MPHGHPKHPPAPPGPRPAGAARRGQGGQGTQARGCTRVRLSQGGGGQGKSAPPGPTAGPPGPEPPARPPAAVGGRRQGSRPPPPLPTPRPKGRRRPAGETAAPHPPGGAAAPRAGTWRPRQARLRAKRPLWTARTLRHYPLPTDNGTAAPRNAQTERPTLRPAWGRQGRGPGQGDHSPPSLPPPPATLTHWRPTGPRLTPTAARQPRLHEYTPGGSTGDKG